MNPIACLPPVSRPMHRLAPALLLASALTAHAAPQLLVPSYFYPSFDPAQSQWDEMTAAAAAGAQVTAIVNPSSGPGAAPNGDYVAAVSAFKAAGGRVIGYVYTCYGRNLCQPGEPPTRSVDQVLAQAADYAAWYDVDGIFLDEMSNAVADLPFYAGVAQGLRALHPAWLLVGNPGTSTPADFLAVADVLVTFEGRGSNVGALPLAWPADAAARQAHLVYGVPDVAGLQAVADEADRRSAGWLYVTDDDYVPGDPARPNPWDTLPTYWAELAALATPAPVDAPAPAALLAVALLAARLTRRLRSAPRAAAAARA